MEKKFVASTKYNDMRGSVAADITDIANLTRWLQERSTLQEGELVVGLELFAGNYIRAVEELDVRFLVKKGNIDELPEALKTSSAVEVREINLSVSVSEFLSIFKVFHLTLSVGGNLEDKEIQMPAI